MAVSRSLKIIFSRQLWKELVLNLPTPTGCLALTLEMGVQQQQTSNNG